jgi:hypothetical protein
MRKFYYLPALLNHNDIIYLADAYSNIVYNNMARETTSELINSTKLGESDYKYYLIALGYYKTNNLKQALKYINYAMNSIDKLKIMAQKVSEFFDYSANQVFENETCINIMKYIIELIGNIIIFIADARIDKSNEEKYMDYNDYIYFFIERLFEIDRIIINLIQNRKISEPMRDELNNLSIIINYYFDLIRNRQNKNHFIKMETQKIQALLYGIK